MNELKSMHMLRFCECAHVCRRVVKVCHGLIALEQVVGASGAKLGGLRCACMWHREHGGREGQRAIEWEWECVWGGGVGGHRWEHVAYMYFF